MQGWEEDAEDEECDADVLWDGWASVEEEDACEEGEEHGGLHHGPDGGMVSGGHGLPDVVLSEGIDASGREDESGEGEGGGGEAVGIGIEEEGGDAGAEGLEEAIGEEVEGAACASAEDDADGGPGESGEDGKEDT